MFSPVEPNSVPVNENAVTKWYKKFSSQPHQPFFTNGIVFLILFMGLFLAAYTSTINLDASVLQYHAYVMVFVIFIQFFLGFVFVVFPRFLMQAEIDKKVYMNQFLLYFISTLGIFISLIFFEKVYIIFAVLMLYAQFQSFRLLYSIFKKSTMKDKYDTKWVLIALLTGIVAHFFYIVSTLEFANYMIVQKFSLNAGFYLFIFTLIFAIAQRMVPFFTSVKVQGYTINKSKAFMELIYTFLVIKVFLLTLDNPSLNIIADLPLLIIFTRELHKWRLSVFKVPAIMWVLYLSLMWIPFGFLLSSLESISHILNLGFFFEKTVIHTFAIGYFVTILIGFGTRVVLGHSGRTPMADKLTIFIFVFVQLLVLLRVGAGLLINSADYYITAINISAALMLVGLIIWSIRYLWILIIGK